jgi:hypothetical protein
MKLSIPLSQFPEFEKLINSPKIVDESCKYQLIAARDQATGYSSCFIDLDRIVGDVTVLKNWLTLAKPEWLYIDPLSAVSSATFIGMTRPSTPVTGQYYFDTTSGRMMIYDGASWLSASA